MTKIKPKTTETSQDVLTFVDRIQDKQKQKDCLELIDILKKLSGFEPKIWGSGIIGFGSYHYKYESGHEGDAPLFGFSSRKNEFALYVANYEGKENFLVKLGKYKTAKACVYIKRLEDIDIEVLKKLIQGSMKYYKKKYL